MKAITDKLLLLFTLLFGLFILFGLFQHVTGNSTEGMTNAVAVEPDKEIKKMEGYNF